MALENADSGGGGDWIPEENLTEMAEGQALAVCKILRILPGEKPKPTSRSEWYPVVVDMLVLSGKFEGSVYRSEKLTRAGFTGTLREKLDPATEGQPFKQRRKIPRTEGTDLAVRFGFYTDNEGVRRLCMNAARADDMEQLKALFKKTGDDPYSWYEAQDRAASGVAVDAAPAVNAVHGSDTAPVQNDKVPATAGAPADDGLPF